MTIRQIGLISETNEVSTAQVAIVAAAIQKQILVDFSPHWEYQAAVSAFDSLADLPPGYWPVVVRDDIGVNEYGVHRTLDGLNPFALVTFSGESWSVTASHEILEMIVDPLGTKTITGPSPIDHSQTVEYLAEVCDPCQEISIDYRVNGIKVSDFVIPAYYKGSGTGRFDLAGGVTTAREIPPGGYVTWRDLSTGEWFSLQTLPNGTTELTSYGQTIAPPNVHLRGTVDRHMAVARQRVKKKAKKPRSVKAVLGRAKSPSMEGYWRKQIANARGV